MPAERLACEGGSPVRATLLPYGRQTIDADDIAAVVKVLQSDWLTTGPLIPEFEAAFAEYVGAEHAVALSSGTAGLHAATFAAGLGPGDEVITTPLTFAASANCAKYVGATPVFADIDNATLNIDPGQVQRRRTPRTRAIVAVDFTGQPADLDELGAIARDGELILIEDACHALGATYKGRKAGSIADMTVFSTHPVKHITTGEGGVVTTNSAELAARLRLFRSHGITSDARSREAAGSWFYEMVALGFNYRITDLQCALGVSQLTHANEWLARRVAIARQYDQAFAAVEGLSLPERRADRSSAWHLYVIRIDANKLTTGREQVFKALRAENIGVNVHYIPVTWHPYYRALGHGPGECPIADSAYESLISLPMFPGMSDNDVRDVIKAVGKVLGAYRR
jgi:UDP-4-amino-4,6-dideoxy-N-acetyl-beta-L-altrosamine transaminase